LVLQVLYFILAFTKHISLHDAKIDTMFCKWWLSYSACPLFLCCLTFVADGWTWHEDGNASRNPSKI